MTTRDFTCPAGLGCGISCGLSGPGDLESSARFHRGRNYDGRHPLALNIISSFDRAVAYLGCGLLIFIAARKYLQLLYCQVLGSLHTNFRTSLSSLCCTPMTACCSISWLHIWLSTLSCVGEGSPHNGNYHSKKRYSCRSSGLSSWAFFFNICHPRQWNVEISWFHSGLASLITEGKR
jgi:hypothetical protein